MEQDLLEELQRIACPACAAIGTRSLSCVGHDPRLPGIPLFRCVQDSSHLWIIQHGTKLLACFEDGEVSFTGLDAEGESREATEVMEEILSGMSEGYTIFASVDPSCLFKMIAPFSFREGVRDLMGVCEERVKSQEKVNFAVNGLSVPEKGEQIVLILGNLKLECRVLDIKHCYAGLGQERSGKLAGTWPIGILCELQSVRPFEGALFEW